MNFFKTILKYIKGKNLSNKEIFFLDNFFYNIKVGFLTILLVVILYFFIYYLIDLGFSLINVKTFENEI